jgi:hypothetical protein
VLATHRISWFFVASYNFERHTQPIEIIKPA